MLSQLVRQSILGFKAALKKKENASKRKSKAWIERRFIKYCKLQRRTFTFCKVRKNMTEKFQSKSGQ